MAKKNPWHQHSSFPDCSKRKLDKKGKEKLFFGFFLNTMATPLVDKCEEVVGSASTSTSRCDSDSDYNCVKSQEHFEEDGDPPICRFCLSENVPAVVRDTTCRRSVWATDSFVQNAIVPTVKFVRRSLRRGAGRGKQEEERERAACKMLSPCDCKGSQKYVHDKCLMYWISQRISKGVSLERAHECPVCKQPYNLPRSFTGIALNLVPRILLFAV